MNVTEIETWRRHIRTCERDKRERLALIRLYSGTMRTGCAGIDTTAGTIRGLEAEVASLQAEIDLRTPLACFTAR